MNLLPLNPLLHRAYAQHISPPTGGEDPLPKETRARVTELVARRNVAPESELDAIDAPICATLICPAPICPTPT